MRPLVIEFADEGIESGLLLENVFARWSGGHFLVRQVHALMPAVLLRTAWPDALEQGLRQGRSLGPMTVSFAGMTDQAVPIENGMHRAFGGYAHIAAKRFTSSSRIFLAPQCGLFFLHETIIASTGSGSWLA